MSDNSTPTWLRALELIRDIVGPRLDVVLLAIIILVLLWRL